MPDAADAPGCDACDRKLTNDSTEGRSNRQRWFAAGPTGSNTPMSRAETKTPEPLPKTLPGVVCTQRVRCGKPACRCTRGPGHLAYYRFWRENGRLRKSYVRREDLAWVRAACEARRQERRELVEAWRQWQELVAIVREVSK
jgi:hypothetical protein